MSHVCRGGYVENPLAVRIVTGIRYSMCPDCLLQTSRAKDIWQYHRLKDALLALDMPEAVDELDDSLRASRTIGEAREVMQGFEDAFDV